AERHDLVECVEDRSAIHVEVGDETFSRDGGELGEIVGAKESLLFGSGGKEENRPGRRMRKRLERFRENQQCSDAGSVVGSAVVDGIAVDGRADAQMIGVSAVDDIFARSEEHTSELQSR